MDGFEEAEAFHTFQKATEELEAALPTLTWDDTNAKAVQEAEHFTGRGSGWVVQLVNVIRPNGEHVRMGTAVKGVLVLKLTDAQCGVVELLARAPVQP